MGANSTSAFLIFYELCNSTPGVVLGIPFISRAGRVSLRYQSIVKADIPRDSAGQILPRGSSGQSRGLTKPI